MLLRNVFTVLLLAVASSVAAVTDLVPRSTDDLLDLLNHELEQRSSYIDFHLRKIDSLRTVADTAVTLQARVSSYEQLGAHFDGINADSAAMYLTKAIDLNREIGDPVATQRDELLHCFQLTVIGAAKESIDLLKSVEDTGVYPENRKLYYETGRFLYYTLAAFYPYHTRQNEYKLQGLPYARGSLVMTPEKTSEHELNKALIHYSEGHNILYIAALNDVIDTSTALDRNFVQANTMLGEIYLANGKTDDAINAFAAAAIANIRNSYRHGTALMRLGMVLYSKGEISTAYKYLTVALDNAVIGGAKINVAPISQALLPVRDDIRKAESHRQTVMLLLLLLLASLLTIIVFLLVKQRREVIILKKMRLKLSKANEVKEVYITEFLNLCSVNMEKLEDFSRLCRRKITAGQSEELVAYIKNGTAIEEQRQNFYSIFDVAFCNIYPTYIDDVNRLLQPDKQLTAMNTELRILAFTRLGMDDTARVARFLGLSLNTIYTYRNKLRNKAINRDTFEADVMKIGQIA